MRAIRQAIPAAVLVALAATLALLPAGCQPRREEAGALIGQDQPGTVIAFVIDTSGSFSGRTDDAYAFFTAAADTYFRASISEHNELIISQVSAAGRPALLWRGPPGDLRTKFPSAAAFRAYLASRSDPAGSRVHDGLIDTIDEVLGRPGVEQGKVRSAVIALTDMDDNASGPDSVRRTEQKLREYRRAKGAVALVWVDQSLAGAWRGRLKDAGFDATNSVVETGIASRPPVLRLDD